MGGMEMKYKITAKTDAFIDFEGETSEEAIQKAFDWCVELKLVK